jgi:acetyl esterase
MLDVSIETAGVSIPLRLFDSRDTRAPGPALIFCHGGGFVFGDLDTYAPLCAALARGLDMPVISIDFRLAPEHPWPAAPDDVEAAVRHIAAHAEAFGRDFTSLILAGDSAGGALAAVTAIALRDEPAALAISALCLMYPTTDLFGQYPSAAELDERFMTSVKKFEWLIEQYRPDPCHWRAAPMLADLRGLPPILIMAVSLDPFRDQARAYATACIAAGCSVTYHEARGTIHGHLSLRAAIPSAEDDLDWLIASLKAMISASKSPSPQVRDRQT